jgi:glycosyltransferase involved in cell wall biosynthesis
LETNLPPSGRYIFDITDMGRFAYIGGPVTGIPRVALTLASQACRLRPDQVAIGYFDVVARCYRSLADPALAAEPDQLQAHLRKVARYVRPVKFWKYRTSGIKSHYQRIARHLKLGMLRASAEFARPKNPDRPIFLQPCDKLICLGSNWDSLDLISYLSGRGALGRIAEFVILVHDLIPLLTPSLPGVVDARLYRHWLERAIEANASLLFYSSSSERDTRSWLGREGHEGVSTRRFRLGDELIAAKPGDIREEVRRLSSESFMLFVGSMKGRKNGINLLKALQQLQSAPNGSRIPCLVAAGSSTPRDLQELLPGGLDFNGPVFVTHPNDAELAWLYNHCRFTVYPSVYEGWGLPVGESLWHGKVCATSNCSSMPEVGGDACEYFDPHDPDDIARALRPLMFDDAYLERKTANIDRTRLRSWQESARDLLMALDEPVRVMKIQQLSP